MREGVGKLLVLVLALVAAIPTTTQAQPEPVINFQIRHYEVAGMTTAEISQSVFQNTPVGMDGGRFAAVTHNRFSTSYSAVATTQGGCEVKNARVVLDSTILLPRLVESGQSARVLAEWNRYIGALRAHEQLHASNGKFTAETLATRLFAFKSHLPCQQMRVKLDQAVDRLIQNMGDWDRRLDSETQHGKSQGVYLRPGFR